MAASKTDDSPRTEDTKAAERRSEESKPSERSPASTGARARAERDEGDLQVSRDTFENPAIATLANTETVEDRNGIERIVSPIAAGFEPAPMEATDEQKKHLEEINKKLGQARKERLGAGKTDDKDRADNNPGDGGSQTPTA